MFDAHVEAFYMSLEGYDQPDQDEPYSWMEPVDTFQEAMDYEANAPYDYVHEAYAEMIEENNSEAFSDACEYEGYTGSYDAWIAARAVRTVAQVNASFDDMPF